MPKGWRFSNEIAADEGMSLSTAQRHLRQLVAQGIWEMQLWPRAESTGYIKPAPIYRKRPKKK